jgi:hypothetical protein
METAGYSAAWDVAIGRYNAQNLQNSDGTCRNLRRRYPLEKTTRKLSRFCRISN